MVSSLQNNAANDDFESPTFKSKECTRLIYKLRGSFFLFGLINNVLYVIILSAALDLVPPNTPKGIIAFCNIFPALIAKLTWPYVLRGTIRYSRRIVGCALLSILGMIVVATSNSLNARLLGISLASFSSGLGELTFLQLSTNYSTVSHALSSTCVGYFASGTGAAGLVGALMWWFLRALGVKEGVGISSVLPLVTPLAYFIVLPSPSVFEQYSFEDAATTDPPAASEYVAVPTTEDAHTEVTATLIASSRKKDDGSASLSLSEKWKLFRPLFARYILPLFCVYTLEYTINQGVGPTLVYTPPTSTPIWNVIIKTIRDYYPLWQLIYQTTVFISRSALMLHIPPLPIRWLPLPAVIQGCILGVLTTESAWGIFEGGDVNGQHPFAITLVAILVAIEGICGGLSYVNTFYHVGREAIDENSPNATQEREFKIGSIGFGDSIGILLASLLSVPMELWLCDVQVGRGRNMCRQL